MQTRRYRVATAACAAVVMMLSHGSAHAAVSGAADHDISGMWWIEKYDPVLKPADGSPVPYTAAGLAAYQSNIADLKSHKLYDKSITRCLPQGLPRAMLSAFPLKIVQHDRSVTFIHEENHTFWHAVIGAPHTYTEDDERAFMGADSVARWEGNALVIDSIGFKSKSFLDETGIPHTDKLHVVQRLRKIDHGKKLEATMTVEDPTIFTKPWTAQRIYEWSPEVKLMEYVCGEPHRALTGQRASAIRLDWTPLPPVPLP